MGQVFFSGLMLICIACFYHWMSKVGILFLEPGKLMLLSWGVGFLLLLSGGIIYQQEFSWLAFGVISSSLFLFSVGSIIGAYIARSRKKKTSGDYTVRVNYTVIRVLVIGVFIYIVLQGYSLLTQSSFITVGLSGLADLRSAHWEGTGNSGKENFLLSITRSSVLLLIPTVIFMIGSGRRNMKLVLGVAIIGVLILVIEGLTKGGRSYLGFAAIYIGFALALIYYRTKISNANRIHAYTIAFPVRWYHLLFGTLFFYFMFIVFPSYRNEQYDGQLEKYMSFRHPSEFGSWVEPLSQIKGFSWVEMAVFGSGYISHSIVKLVFFIEETILPDLYMLGFHSGKVFVKLASLLDTDLYVAWLGTGDIIAGELSQHGLNTNPWGTLLKDLIIDFGLWGAPLAMFILGFSAQFLFRKLMHTQQAESMTLGVVIVVACSMSGFFGPLVNNTIAYPLFLMTILVWSSKMRIKAK